MTVDGAHVAPRSSLAEKWMSAVANSAQTSYARPGRVGLPVMAGVSLPSACGTSVVGTAQLRPPSTEWLATTVWNGVSPPKKKGARPAKYTVPSLPEDSHGSAALSAVPPSHFV